MTFNLNRDFTTTFDASFSSFVSNEKETEMVQKYFRNESEVCLQNTQSWGVQLSDDLTHEIAKDPYVMNSAVQAAKSAQDSNCGLYSTNSAHLNPPSSINSKSEGAGRSAKYANNKKNLMNNNNIDREEGDSKMNSEPIPAARNLPEGVVGRRAPLNPFASPRLGKYRKGGGKKKVKDPKLNNNPLSGRLVVTYTTSAIIIWMFLQELVYTYSSFNGRCVSPVLYPKYDLQPAEQPYILNVGYGACEHNIGTKADRRHVVGSAASDDGWPIDLVDEGKNSGESKASWDSPNGRIYSILGGLDTNMIRNYNEVYRVFWSMYLHGGFLHILINLSCQIQTLWMIEPDWGFWRTALLFFIGGISGNLLSAVADPCSVTVGSSGAMYATLGALIPYCVEYWKTIPRPCCILIFMVIVIIIGIITGCTGITDNFAHMGGCIAGILWGFGTITSVAACDKCTLGERMALTPPFSWFVSKNKQEKLKIRAAERKKKGNDQRLKALRNKKIAEGMRGKAIHEIKLRFTEEGTPPCKMAKREWFVRISAILCIIAFWVVCWLYLMNPDAYKQMQPTGQLKFSGWLFCKCCTIKSSKNKLFTGAENLYWCFGGKEAEKFYCQ